MSVYDELDFAPMLITDVFIPHKGKRLTSASRRPGGVPFVSASEFFNSVSEFSDTQPLFPGGWLTLTYDGSIGHAKYQPVPFFASDSVIALEPRHKAASEGALLLFASAITRECVPKYSYGVKLNLSRLAKQTIMVPVTRDTAGEQVVDWDGMTRFGRELLDTAIAHTHSTRQADPDDATRSLPDLRFEPMLITDVFEIYNPKIPLDVVNIKPHRVGAKYPYVTQTGLSNGVHQYVGHQDYDLEKAGSFIVGMNTQTVFFQEKPFYVARKTAILTPKTPVTSSQALVLRATLAKQIAKFSYGFQANLQRLSRTRIMVPVTTDPASGEQVVDWDGMNQYGRILRARAEQELAVATDKLAART